MALPEDFNKIYGSTATGGLTPISDVNYAKGWEFVGPNPPTKNDFSYLQNLSDLKSQWLYNYLTTASNAASRTVGTGTNQIPDMSAFAANLSSSGYQKLPGGYVRQWGSGLPNINGDATVSFPIAFTGVPYAVTFGYRQATTPDAVQSVIINDQTMSNTGFSVRAYKIDGTMTITGSSSAFYWVAEGKI